MVSFGELIPDCLCETLRSDLAMTARGDDCSTAHVRASSEYINRDITFASSCWYIVLPKYAPPFKAKEVTQSTNILSSSAV